MSGQTKAWRKKIDATGFDEAYLAGDLLCACDQLDSLESRLENLEEVYALSCDQRDSLESRLALVNEKEPDLVGAWSEVKRLNARLKLAEAVCEAAVKFIRVPYGFGANEESQLIRVVEAYLAAKGKKGV